MLLCREGVTMKLLQENAELGVREMLMEIGSKTKVTVNETNQCSNYVAAFWHSIPKKLTGSSILYAEDFMDDGTVIKLKITIADDVSRP